VSHGGRLAKFFGSRIVLVLIAAIAEYATTPP
jgi:hypothetical protein